MFIMLEAEFGDIKISKIRTKTYHPIPTEENQFLVRFWDADDILKRTAIPKGTVKITYMVKVPPCCPHCKQELPMGFARFDDLVDMDIYEYKGAVIKSMAKYTETDYDGWAIGDVVEMVIKYETVEYKTCFPRATN